MQSRIVTLITLASVISVLALADDSGRTKGMIISRTGETLIVRTSGGSTTVVLGDDTTTVDNRGLLGARQEQLSDVVLIPGLKVDVLGTSDSQGRLVARKIIVDGDDLEASEMIQSGLHPTAEQVETNVQAIATNKQNIESHDVQLAAQKQDIAANKQQITKNMSDIEENTNRFMALSEYDVKGQATVNFGVGSANIMAPDQQELKKLAQTATGLKGYIIEVTGYADSTGGAAMNTKLSEDRAKAVITYLVQQGGIPVRHIVAPGAMGEYGGAATNETKLGRAQNRRVEVKVLVNKGIAGS
jgi:OOP family OmpA-OmpF porin